MSQDVVSDALNQIMNAKKVEKKSVEIKRYSKVLLNLLDLMKNKGHIDYNLNEESKSLSISIIRLNDCRAIKPRYYVGYSDIQRYLKRFLPSRKFGDLIISTNLGLISHKEAATKKIGGSLIAYFY